MAKQRGNDVVAKDKPKPGSRFVASEDRWTPTRWTGEFGRLALDAVDRDAPDRPIGARPAHQNGFVLEGEFTPLSKGPTKTLLSEYTDFKGFVNSSQTPARARLSMLKASLDRPGIMGLAVKLDDKKDEATDLLSLSVDVLPVAKTKDFAILLDTFRRGPLAVPKLTGLVASRRASARALVRTWQASRINHGNGLATTFHGVQTYRLVKSGPKQRSPAMFTPMRFCWVPDPANPAGPYGGGFSLGTERVDGSIRFHLDLHVRPLPPGLEQQERERLDDPRYRWQRSTIVIRAGTLRLDPEVTPEAPGTLAFNPSVLAPGIAMGPNDLFSGRQSAYSISFARRAAEAGVLR